MARNLTSNLPAHQNTKGFLKLGSHSHTLESVIKSDPETFE